MAGVAGVAAPGGRRAVAIFLAAARADCVSRPRAPRGHVRRPVAHRPVRRVHPPRRDAMGGPPARHHPARRQGGPDAGVAPLQLPGAAPGHAHPRCAADRAVPQVAAPHRRRPPSARRRLHRELHAGGRWDRVLRHARAPRAVADAAADRGGAPPPLHLPRPRRADDARRDHHGDRDHRVRQQAQPGVPAQVPGRPRQTRQGHHRDAQPHARHQAAGVGGEVRRQGERHPEGGARVARQDHALHVRQHGGILERPARHDGARVRDLHRLRRAAGRRQGVHGDGVLPHAGRPHAELPADDRHVHAGVRVARQAEQVPDGRRDRHDGRGARRERRRRGTRGGQGASWGVCVGRAGRRGDEGQGQQPGPSPPWRSGDEWARKWGGFGDGAEGD
ncbi:hypothetical protein PVAP13_7NG063834 [Panicum virgatum]|uniref:Uncharacterized protein n=1 Tax=Panicum virgatum TaxID=38727 RepID=A0A8T0PY29_PANVG|nr:hypothetical protein PVAP13_7NG063834 [Panicum virgatum]